MCRNGAASVRPGNGKAAPVGKALVSPSHSPTCLPPHLSVEAFNNLPAAMLAAPAMPLRAGTGDGVTVSIMLLRHPKRKEKTETWPLMLSRVIHVLAIHGAAHSLRPPSLSPSCCETMHCHCKHFYHYYHFCCCYYCS